MAANILPVIPKRVIDFGGIATGTQTVVLAERLPVPFWREVTMVVRVHSHTLASASNSIQIQAKPESWTEEDPGMVFLTTGGAGNTITIANTTPSPALFETALQMLGSGGIVELVRVDAIGTRGAAGPMSAIISVGFSPKSA